MSEKTNIYKKFVVTRTDGRSVPDAVYFVLRVDRQDHGWDQMCRLLLRHMAHRMKADGDPEKNKFGKALDEFIANPKGIE